STRSVRASDSGQQATQNRNATPANRSAPRLLISRRVLVRRSRQGRRSRSYSRFRERNLLQCGDDARIAGLSELLTREDRAENFPDVFGVPARGHGRREKEQE